MEHVEKYASIAQRVASSYLRSLAGSGEIAPGQGGEEQVGQGDLRAFFQAFYMALYAHPEQFGLPLVEDDSFVEGEQNGTAHKAELNRKRKKPQDLIAAGLGFLMDAGCDGRLEGQALVLDEASAARVKKNRGLRAFLQGLRQATELAMVETGGGLRLASPRYPAMMPALQALSRGCAVYPEANLGAFYFARCDFRALQPGYVTGPLDLYRIFPAADFARLAELHRFFMDRKYKAIVAVRDVSAWTVQYQGNRKVKSTPLFQVEFQERFRNPLIVQFKPASTARIAHLLPQQSQALQDDFFRRAYRCRGDECGWCKNHKTLGPSTIELNGQPVTVCWYTYPVVSSDEQTIPLVEEYTRMHEALVN